MIVSPTVNIETSAMLFMQRVASEISRAAAKSEGVNFVGLSKELEAMLVNVVTITRQAAEEKPDEAATDVAEPAPPEAVEKQNENQDETEAVQDGGLDGIDFSKCVAGRFSDQD